MPAPAPALPVALPIIAPKPAPPHVPIAAPFSLVGSGAEQRIKVTKSNSAGNPTDFFISNPCVCEPTGQPLILRSRFLPAPGSIAAPPKPWPRRNTLSDSVVQD